MICRTCLNDLTTGNFNPGVYKNALIEGRLVDCSECSRLTKANRTLRRRVAAADIEDGLKLKKQVRKAKTRAKSKEDKKWRKLDPEQKRASLKGRRTVYEQILERGIVAQHLQFDIQVPVGPYFVDFQILPVKLAVEVDGESHDSEESKRKDFYRDQYIKGRGWTILRFRNEEVQHHLPRVVRQIVEKRDLMMGKKIVVSPVRAKVKEKEDAFPYGALASSMAGRIVVIPPKERAAS